MSTDKTDGAPDVRIDPLARFKGLVRQAIDRKKISEREASRRAGLNAGYVNDLLRSRAKTVETDKILALADSLEIPASEIGESAGASISLTAHRERVSHLALAPGPASTVPLYSAGLAGGKPWASFQWVPATSVPALPGLEAVKGAFAFKVGNDANAPRYYKGDTVYVSPAADVGEGDFVFVRLTNDESGIARLRALTDLSAVFEQVGRDNDERTIELREVAFAYRIVGSLG